MLNFTLHGLRGSKTAHLLAFHLFFHLWSSCRLYQPCRPPESGDESITPLKIQFNPIMKVWKIIFLCKWVSLRFRLKFPGKVTFQDRQRTTCQKKSFPYIKKSYGSCRNTSSKSAGKSVSLKIGFPRKSVSLKHLET